MDTASKPKVPAESVVLALHGAGYAGTERHVRSLALGLHSRG